ncbi:hypothetical protein Tco_0921055, partial [Tanacetum coccineum]
MDVLKDIVDFEVEGEENVVITRNTTDDPWLNKLVGNGTFIGQTDDATSNLGGRFNHEENDPEDDIVDPKFKSKPFVRYPSFDPSTPWDQCKPVLGMKFKNPQQQKNMLANYGVSNGYQLWFMQNDHSKLLVYCGRNCKRAKTCTLYDHEGGLIEHYSKLWEYRQAVLEYNPGSTCHLETEDKDDGKIYFKRMYICFKGIKQGWLDACRKVIGLDGCFLTHTCKGQLLTAIEDLELGYGGGVTVISDGHKGLIEAVASILPDSEHMQCARHIYANFKKKWSGLQYKRLFWGATSCTADSQFLLKMEEIKELDLAAYKWLVERNPNSWCRAFFEMDRCSAVFKNGISESFNARIVPARGKPIITMLEDIRIYVMQRMCHMNKVLVKLEDTITPSIRKRLEYLKEKQSWVVYPSRFREVEVRRGDYAYGFNLRTKQCGCRFWELSGIPCVHAMAAYYHMKMEPKLGVNNFLSKQSWYNAYQYSIRPVPGSKLWKTYDNPSPYPPIERKRPGRPRKQRIIHPTEDDNRVTRLGRVMHCHTCWEVGHNKKGCQNQPRPKPLGLATTIGKPPQIPTNSKGKGIDMGTKKRGNTNVMAGSSKKRGTIRIGSPIKRGEDNQVTEDTSMGD